MFLVRDCSVNDDDVRRKELNLELNTAYGSNPHN